MYLGIQEGLGVTADTLVCPGKALLRLDGFASEDYRLQFRHYKPLNDILPTLLGTPATVPGPGGAIAHVLSIQGYTDTTGPETMNKGLSRMRAAEVARFLQVAGVTLPVSVDGMGPTSLFGDNKTPAGRSRNRCVEIRICAFGVSPGGPTLPRGGIA